MVHRKGRGHRLSCRSRPPGRPPPPFVKTRYGCYHGMDEWSQRERLRLAAPRQGLRARSGRIEGVSGYGPLRVFASGAILRARIRAVLTSAGRCDAIGPNPALELGRSRPSSTPPEVVPQEAPGVLSGAVRFGVRSESTDGVEERSRGWYAPNRSGFPELSPGFGADFNRYRHPSQALSAPRSHMQPQPPRPHNPRRAPEATRPSSCTLRTSQKKASSLSFTSMSPVSSMEAFGGLQSGQETADVPTRPRRSSSRLTAVNARDSRIRTSAYASTKLSACSAV